MGKLRHVPTPFWALSIFKGQMNQNFYMQCVEGGQNKHILKFETNWTWHHRDIES